MQVLLLINAVLGSLFFICYSYQIFYIIVGFVKKPRAHGPEIPHSFAVLISARNEEKVIGDLLRSINAQTYPSERITTFVVADNCTDNTADVSRGEGAIVYERNDLTKIGKGYAIDFLLQKINHEYPEDAFDAFFVFDADNVLEPNYIEEMNKTYSDGYKIITSYRNSKNYGDNWISAGYGLWFLREARFLNGSRMLLGTSCAVSGTGFMFDRSAVENGTDGKKEWHYFLLTEDIEFSTSKIIGGERIGFCPDALFYDEQPITFRQSWRQRMRWAKGYLQVFKHYGRELIAGIFRSKKDKRPRNNFSCFDMSMTIMPALILSGLVLVVDIISAIVSVVFVHDPHTLIKLILLPLVNASFLIFVVGIITTISEWKNIHTSVPRKILFMFTFPLFMITYIPIAIVALLKKDVKWTHIDHVRACSVDEIKQTPGETDNNPSESENPAGDAEETSGDTDDVSDSELTE